MFAIGAINVLFDTIIYFRCGWSITVFFCSINVSTIFHWETHGFIFSDPTSNNEEMLKRLQEVCFLLGFVFFAGAAANAGRIFLMQTSGILFKKQQIVKCIPQMFKCFGDLYTINLSLLQYPLASLGFLRTFIGGFWIIFS